MINIRQLLFPRYLFISGFIFIGCNIYSFYTLYNIIYDINNLTIQNNEILLEICKISDDTSKILKCILKDAEIEEIQEEEVKEEVEKEEIQEEIQEEYDYIDYIPSEKMIVTNHNTNWLPNCIFKLTKS